MAIPDIIKLRRAAAGDRAELAQSMAKNIIRANGGMRKPVVTDDNGEEFADAIARIARASKRL